MLDAEPVVYLSSASSNTTAGADPGLTVGGCLGYRNTACALAHTKILCHAHFLRHFCTHERIGIVATKQIKVSQN